MKNNESAGYESPLAKVHKRVTESNGGALLAPTSPVQKIPSIFQGANKRKMLHYLRRYEIAGCVGDFAARCDCRNPTCGNCDPGPKCGFNHAVSPCPVAPQIAKFACGGARARRMKTGLFPAEKPCARPPARTAPTGGAARVVCGVAGKIRFCLLRCLCTGRCRDERPGLDSRVGSGAERLSGTATRMRGVRLTASILRRRRVGVNGPKIDLGRIGSRPESRPFHRPASPEIGKERSG